MRPPAVESGGNAALDLQVAFAFLQGGEQVAEDGLAQVLAG
ncbi:MAG TPA: hypothetical protein PK440_19675 [Candidatus Accumulibacter phosphatis]|nr:hypothetical protein [Candidatus Accumulibacter phosphatis]HRQ97185.1 hypothetical protein [Candidatus Accumulibacter phosphatis]